MPKVSIVDALPYESEQYLKASEHMHQSAFVEIMDTQYRDYHDIFYAIPNGGGRGKVEAINLVKEGVKAGIPDTHIPVATFFGENVIYVGFPVGNCQIRSLSLYLEFKDMKRSSGPSEKQIKKIERLRKYGNFAFVVHGWKQALCAWLYYIGRMDVAECFMVSGLNIPQQLMGDYSPNSWQKP